MPRYIVQRTFPEGLNIPIGEDGRTVCARVGENNEAEGVTWIHSYVSHDRRHTFCVYDGPDPESIRRCAARNQLPIDQITRVTVLDPYFYA